MITEQDLQEAIAECEGTRNPNANTCIKLAAFYTIKRELFGGGINQSITDYSLDSPPVTYTNTNNYTSDTEFGYAVDGLDYDVIMEVMDELMSTIQIINPRLYNGVIRKLNQSHDG